jgi:predicted dehydrogenase
LFGILGSGFGTYGYLPSLIGLGHTVGVLKRSIPSILNRQATKVYLKNLEIFDSQEDLCRTVPNLVIALPPEEQYDVIASLKSPGPRLFLEKPLAPSINLHEQAIAILTERNIDFSVGYTFLYSPWVETFVNLVGSEEVSSIYLRWEVLKSRQAWKNRPSSGGGLTSFYGIHLPALLNYFFPPANNQLRVQHQSDFLFSQSVVIERGKSEPITLNFEISYSSRAKFDLKYSDTNGVKKVIYSEVTPFGSQGTPDQPDPRITCLSSYINDVISGRLSPSLALELEKGVLNWRKSCEAR